MGFGQDSLSSGGTIDGDLILDGDLDLTATDTNQIILPSNDDVANPALKIGASGFNESASAVLDVIVDGSKKFNFTFLQMQGSTPGSGAFKNVTSTSVIPAFITNRGDSDTGVGWADFDQLSLTAGAIEGIRLTEVSGGIVQKVQTTAGLTADSSSAQGGTPLVSSYNEISTVATAGDSVTLPAALAGNLVLIFNNTATSADVFPDVGDNLGAGVDIAVALAGGAVIKYWAIDATNYKAV